MVAVARRRAAALGLGNVEHRAVLDGLSADELAAVATKVESGFELFRADGGYELSGVALGAVAG